MRFRINSQEEKRCVNKNPNLFQMIITLKKKNSQNNDVYIKEYSKESWHKTQLFEKCVENYLNDLALFAGQIC